MNGLDIRFENGEVLDAERLNQIVDCTDGRVGI
jgi:hypothetical protein